MNNREQEEIRDWLKTVRFKKQLIGGVSEQDVWEKIEQLNEMYNKALSAERARYDALLDSIKVDSSPKHKVPNPVTRRRDLLNG